MNIKGYTSGELATASGLTIRAIQHYDNIGLLPSSGRTAGGRRYYTQDDLIRLEQIVLYKSLGFSLDQIKKQLLPWPNTKELLEMFKNQQLLLLERIEQLHTSFITIDVMSKMVHMGQQPPFHVLFQFLNALPGDDAFSKMPDLLTKEQHEALSPYFQDFEEIQIFYHKWKELSIEAAVLEHMGIPPENTLAQDLAKRWWDMIMALTGGDPELLKLISELALDSRMIARNTSIMASADNYIDNALAIYAEKNELSPEIPVGGSERRKNND